MSVVYASVSADQVDEGKHSFCQCLDVYKYADCEACWTGCQQHCSLRARNLAMLSSPEMCLSLSSVKSPMLLSIHILSSWSQLTLQSASVQDRDGDNPKIPYLDGLPMEYWVVPPRTSVLQSPRMSLASSVLHRTGHASLSDTFARTAQSNAALARSLNASR